MQAVCIHGMASKCPTEDKNNVFVCSLDRKTVLPADALIHVMDSAAYVQ